MGFVKRLQSMFVKNTNAEELKGKDTGGGAVKSTDQAEAPKPSTEYQFKHPPLKRGLNVLRSAGLASSNSAKFGMVRKNKDGSPRAHQGVDLAIPIGFRCYAVDDATVFETNNSDTGGYGKWVILKLFNSPDDCRYVFYAHLDVIHVHTGQKVKAGDVIGLTGHSGNARGMTSIARGGHLHFETRKIARPGKGLEGRTDPLRFFKIDKEHNKSLL